MLVEFSVANFRSIRDAQTLSLVASAGKEHRDSHVLAGVARATPDLLRSAVIYGANAAGKSNLVRALQFMARFVRDSSREGQKRDSIEVTPFAADDHSHTQPCQFEATFVECGVRYQYGFAVTTERVEREWLTAWPKGQPQIWFDRSAGTEDWQFGASLRGQRKAWQKATRDNALFLSTAVQLNAEQLVPVFDWFVKRLHAAASFGGFDRGFTASQCKPGSSLRESILQFLRKADLGIDDVEVEYGKFEESMLPNDMPESVREQVRKDLADRQLIKDLSFTHHTSRGHSMTLPYVDESDGTQRLFSLMGPCLDVLKRGYILVIDEMDTSLHPLLLRELVKLFHDPKVNPDGAQLIFTTHDTSILDNEVFRRDQVWFVEKDSDLATHAYPLTDYHPRKSESFARGYLNGRYGAVPFLGDLVV